jgi:hypothetical protein
MPLPMPMPLSWLLPIEADTSLKIYWHKWLYKHSVEREGAITAFEQKAIQPKRQLP